jgi:hypothetical protein
MQMKRGISSPVTGVVTLDTELPPDKLLPGTEPTSEPILVVCEIEGYLEGNPNEFEIQPADWEPRSLIGRQNAKWIWIVTPKIGGTLSLVMKLRPVVRAEERSGKILLSRPTTVPFSSTVHVSLPPDEAISDRATRTKTVLESLSGMVKALLGLLVLLVALLTGRWFRSRRSTT